jgi:acyl-CoA thioester hydrolase
MIEHGFDLRVYWEDTDAGGIVYYANVLRFMERARTEWLRSLGVQQQRLRVDEHVLFVVADARLRWHAPARLDDALRVNTRLVERGRASLRLRQAVRRGDTLIADGDVRIGCVDAGTFMPRRIPNSVNERLA